MVGVSRCNVLLSLALVASGNGCHYVAKCDSDDVDVKDMSEHLPSVHQLDADAMKLNILASTKTNNG